MQEQNDDERRTTDPWHIKRELQLGHLITTLTVALSVIWYVSKLDQRISLVEHQIVVQRERDDRQDRDAGEAVSQVRLQLSRIEDKLDRAIERSTAAAKR